MKNIALYAFALVMLALAGFAFYLGVSEEISDFGLFGWASRSAAKIIAGVVGFAGFGIVVTASDHKRKEEDPEKKWLFKIAYYAGAALIVIAFIIIWWFKNGN